MLVLLDFRKAYDTVNREKLLRSLYSIAGTKFVDNINAIYKTVQYSIKVKGKVLDPIHTNLGL